MTEFRDLSRLPVDQTYWEDLEARIMADLGPQVRASRGTGETWLAPIAARAWRLGGLAIAAGLAALMLVPARAQERVTPSGLLRLPSDDATIAAFVEAASPPAIASLVLPRREDAAR